MFLDIHGHSASRTGFLFCNPPSDPSHAALERVNRCPFCLPFLTPHSRPLPTQDWRYLSTNPPPLYPTPNSPLYPTPHSPCPSTPIPPCLHPPFPIYRSPLLTPPLPSFYPTASNLVVHKKRLPQHLLLCTSLDNPCTLSSNLATPPPFFPIMPNSVPLYFLFCIFCDFSDIICIVLHTKPPNRDATLSYLGKRKSQLYLGLSPLPHGYIC